METLQQAIQYIRTCPDYPFFAIDLFCGAGGETSGIEAATVNGRKVAKVFACVNHDPHAIASHAANHPDTLHYIEDIRTLNTGGLEEMVRTIRETHPGSKVILHASCECTNYSRAKGGLPRDPDSRTLPEHLYRYIEALNPDYVQLENIEDFMCWGDLDEDGHPLSKDAGRLYLLWVNHIRNYGYDYHYRILNAADFGAYTSRKRYFGIFSRPGLPVAFPEPTHAKNPDKGLFGTLQPWKAVRDVLDLDDEGKSIFDRDKPLVDATLRRIYAGLRKFTASKEDTFLVKNYSGDDASKCISTDGPSGTVTCKDHHSLVKVSFLDKQYGTGVAASVGNPCGTLTTVPKEKLVTVTQFLDQQYGNSKPAGLESPCGTITTNPKQNLVTVEKRETLLLNPQYNWPMYGTDKPCPTIIARQDKRPMYSVTTNYGNGMITDSGNDSETMKELKSFCRENGIMDVKMRMLKIEELLTIMGFPRNYILVGTSSEKKKYIGNAVECGMARHLMQALASA